VVTGQLPFPSPALFWLLAKLAELCPTEACPPEGQGAEFFVRKSATKERRRRIPHRRPLEERQGLDGPERARTIRQDSSQKSVADKTGPGVRSPATAPRAPTAGRTSGRPFGVSPGEHTPPATTNPSKPVTPACRGRRARRTRPLRDGRSAAGNHLRKPATQGRTARGDRPRKAGHLLAILGGRGAGPLRSARRRGGTLSHCCR